MEHIMQAFQFVMQHAVEIVGAVLMILGGFSVLARFTPTEVDNKVIDGIITFIHKLGLSGKK